MTPWLVAVARSCECESHDLAMQGRDGQAEVMGQDLAGKQEWVSTVTQVQRIAFERQDERIEFREFRRGEAVDPSLQFLRGQVAKFRRKARDASRPFDAVVDAAHTTGALVSVSDCRAVVAWTGRGRVAGRGFRFAPRAL